MCPFIQVWQQADPLIWVRESLREDQYGNVVESIGKCYSAHPWVYLVPLILIQLVTYVGGVYICYQNRMMSSEFHEGKYISFSMVNTMQTFIIGE